jgi:UDP-GlcNAc:undecaprenyl-phosphate GlcNAc-1-phosphate transferase
VHPEIQLLVLFAAGAVVSALLSLLARAVSPRLAFVDRPDVARKEGRPAVPYGGGFALLLPFLCGVGAVWLCGRGGGGSSPAAEGMAGMLAPRDAGLLPRLGFVVLGGGLVFAMGLADDIWKIRPLWKLLVQVGAALLLVVGGVRITAHVPSTAVSVLLTVAWVVGITNSFNLLDNMDGLSAGIAAIASFIFAMVLIASGQAVLASLLAVLSGAAAGFLTQNFHPARLYMGDAGSYFLGFTLSALTVEATFYSHAGPRPASPVMLALGVPLLIMAVPMFDTATVLWIRLREGRPLWVGDRSHLSHRLVGTGLTVRGAVLAIYLLTLACGIGALLLRDLSVIGGVLVLAQAAAILAVVAILEGLGRRGNGGQ